MLVSFVYHTEPKAENKEKKKKHSSNVILSTDFHSRLDEKQLPIFDTAKMPVSFWTHGVVQGTHAVFHS